MDIEEIVFPRTHIPFFRRATADRTLKKRAGEAARGLEGGPWSLNNSLSRAICNAIGSGIGGEEGGAAAAFVCPSKSSFPPQPHLPVASSIIPPPLPRIAVMGVGVAASYLNWPKGQNTL